MTDAELKKLLAEFQQNKPSDLQVQKWKRAVRGAAQAPLKIKRDFGWRGVAVAMIVGIVIGFGATKFTQPRHETKPGIETSFDSADATVERIYVKTD
ncbi:MAG TPA: hypothetical protein VM432_09360 [Bdellovibrionales bacterium]|nr:hypothetical protein [Bdellovibrionales bacterium]